MSKNQERTAFRASIWAPITPSNDIIDTPGAIFATAGTVIIEDSEGNQLTRVLTEDRDLSYRPSKVLPGTTSIVYALY